MIVDVHAHLGFDQVFDEDFTEEELWEAHEAGVDVSIVQPGTCVALADVQRQHDAIAELCARDPEAFFGLANPCPHLPTDEYRAELARCVEDLGFVGVKMHPLAHAVNPGGTAARRIFDAARDLGIPVMIHTGAGVPFALPSLQIQLAQAYPEVKVVLAHAGASIFAGEAVLAVRTCPNVYLDTSWSAGYALRGWVKTLGTNRLMLASDHGDNAIVELMKHRSLGLSEEVTVHGVRREGTEGWRDARPSGH